MPITKATLIERVYLTLRSRNVCEVVQLGQTLILKAKGVPIAKITQRKGYAVSRIISKEIGLRTIMEENAVYKIEEFWLKTMGTSRAGK